MSSTEHERSNVGIVVVDHGSRRAESNDLLLDVVAMFREQSGYEIVEPAHMEIAEPTIQTAFDRCVERGAKLVVIHPYFLAPGRHWKEDIPKLAAEAALKADKAADKARSRDSATKKKAKREYAKKLAKKAKRKDRATKLARKKNGGKKKPS